MKATTRCLLVVAVLANTLAACASAGSEEPVAAADGDLVNSPRDTKNPWSVGLCAGGLITDPAAGIVGACKSLRCSGSLIAPNVVLTARHCIGKIDFPPNEPFCAGTFSGVPLSPEPLRVTLSPSVRVGDGTTPPAWLDVASITFPAGNNLCADDVALVVLAQNVPSASATPVSVDLRNLTRRRPDRVAVVARGGLTKLIDPTTLKTIDAAPGDDFRRFKEKIPFLCVSNTDHRCSTVDISTPGGTFALPASYFLIGAGIASGDSGGGILRQNSFAAGAPEIVGVVAASTFGTDGVGNAALATRVDRHEEIIRSTVQAAATTGAYAAPAWASADDE